MIALLPVFSALAAQEMRFGTLTACVVQAQSLENLDANNLHFFNFGDTSDPYATLRVEGQVHQLHAPALHGVHSRPSPLQPLQLALQSMCLARALSACCALTPTGVHDCDSLG